MPNTLAEYRAQIEAFSANAAALENQASSLRAQGQTGLADSLMAQAAALRNQARAAEWALANAQNAVLSTGRKAILQRGAAEVNGIAWGAIIEAQKAYAAAGTLSMTDKLTIMARIVSPVIRFVVSSPADEKVAKLVGARRLLNNAYEAMRANWKLRPEFADPLAKELPQAAADLDKTYRALVGWSGNLNAAIQGMDTPLTAADSFISAYFGGVAKSVESLGRIVDDVLAALKALLEAIRKGAEAAAGLPGWLLLAIGAPIGGYFIYKAATK